METATHLSLIHRDVGQGRPVVLLHAFPLSNTMWRRQVAALKAEYRVITPNLGGFGGTAGSQDIASIDDMADSVAALLDHLEVVEPVALCGLSMGGYVALAFARKYPARVGALILADTRAEPDTAEGKSKRDEMIALASEQGAPAVVEQMLPKLVGATTQRERPDVVEEIKSIVVAQSKEAVVGALRALRDRADARDWLASIRVPTLVIVGSEDTLTTPAIAQALADGIPGARLAIIEGAGHLSNLEQPQRFNEALLEFLLAAG